MKGGDNMTVKQIVEQYLRQHGYDGLCWHNGGETCGCELCDLMPCDGAGPDCAAGYKGPGIEGGDWAIYPSKDAVANAEAKT